MILTGWKEISKHLRYGVRTVQRWERNGLPIKRVNNTPRSPVVADSEELDAWILHRMQLPPGASRELAENLKRTRELRRESQELRRELHARMEALRKTLAEARAKRRTDREQERERERETEVNERNGLFSTPILAAAPFSPHCAR